MTDYSFFIHQSSSDPTRTTTLRAKWVADWNRRIRALQRVVWKSVVVNDCLGLKEGERPTLQTQAALEPATPKQWAYRWSHEKVAEFMKWLQEMESRSLLEIVMRDTLRPGGEPWSNIYVRSAYQRGLSMAYDEMRKRSSGEIARRLGLTEADFPPTFRPTGGAISAIMQQPFHADRLALAYTRVFDELKGVTAEMDKQISQVLTRGIAEGLNPKDIGELLADRIEKIGGTRGRLIARTETIHVHQQAALNEYYATEQATGEVFLVEWKATMDSRVRDTHAERNRRVYTKEESYRLVGEPNCLIDGQVRIYTSTGWKAIRDVVVDDLVLTHKGRFRKVIKVHKNVGSPNEGITTLSWGNRRQQTLTLTDNHPLMVNGRWLPAKRVSVGCSISYLASECRRADCRNLVPHFNSYCSASCSSKDISEGQWRRPEHRENVSKKARDQMLREYESGTRDSHTITERAVQATRDRSARGEFILQQPHVRDIIRKVTNTQEMREKSSEHMSKLYNLPEWKAKLSGRSKRFLLENPDKHPCVVLRDRNFVSSLEDRMAEVLDRVGLVYVRQHPIRTYRVDFAIPSMRLVIECDGDYWHGSDEAKAKDRKRDKELESAGWMVLHYTEKMIRGCLDEVEAELVRIVNNHDGNFLFLQATIVLVDHRTTSRRPWLWNLTVDEDESFVANGFVVHNCRCALLPFIPAVQGMPEKASPAARAAAERSLGTGKVSAVEKAEKELPIHTVIDKVSSLDKTRVEYLKNKLSLFAGKDRDIGVVSMALDDMRFGQKGLLSLDPEGNVLGAVSYTIEDKFLSISNISSAIPGLGSVMMKELLGIALQESIGIEVYSIPQAVGFYKKVGLIREEGSRRFFLMLEDIKSMLKDVGTTKDQKSKPAVWDPPKKFSQDWYNERAKNWGFKEAYANRMNKDTFKELMNGIGPHLDNLLERFPTLNPIVFQNLELPNSKYDTTWKRRGLVLHNGENISSDLYSGRANGYYIDGSVHVAIKGERWNFPEPIKIPSPYQTTGEVMDGLATLRHEYGHFVHDMVSKAKKEEWIEIFKSEGGTMIEGRHRMSYKSPIAHNVSQYAASNEKEFFAECFTAYTDIEYGQHGRLPESVEKFFKELLG